MSLDAIGIISDDMDKSIEFYQCFGLDFEMFGENEHAEALLPSGVRLMIDSKELMKKLYPNKEIKRGNSIVLCFKFETSSELDERFHFLSDSKYSVLKSPEDMFWGQRYASVEDPDGNQVDLFCTLNEQE